MNPPIEELDLSRPNLWAVLYIMKWEENPTTFPEIHGIYESEADALAFLKWAHTQPYSKPGEVRYWVCKAHWRKPRLHAQEGGKDHG